MHRSTREVDERKKKKKKKANKKRAATQLAKGRDLGAPTKKRRLSMKAQPADLHGADAIATPVREVHRYDEADECKWMYLMGANEMYLVGMTVGVGNFEAIIHTIGEECNRGKLVTKAAAKARAAELKKGTGA